MARSPVPKRILRARELGEQHPSEFPRYLIVDAVRDLRKWLEEPAVSEELRQGNSELLASFRTYLAETKGKNTFTIITREEIEARKEAIGKTLH